MTWAYSVVALPAVATNELLKLLDQATMAVADFGNPRVKVIRRDEAEAILRTALASARPEVVAPQWDKVERRKDNWTLITAEYGPKIGYRYKGWNGEELHFFGIVHGGDDYYYGLMDKDGKTTLASCVGALEKPKGWYEQIRSPSPSSLLVTCL